jgi:hypothetical protein
MGLKVVEGRDFAEADVLEIDLRHRRPDQANPTGDPHASLARCCSRTPHLRGKGSIRRRQRQATRVVGVVETLQTPGAGRFSANTRDAAGAPLVSVLAVCDPRRAGQLDRVLKDAREA